MSTPDTYRFIDTCLVKGDILVKYGKKHTHKVVVKLGEKAIQTVVEVFLNPGLRGKYC